jgi:hypothetical protein
MSRTHAHRSYTARLVSSHRPVERHDHRHGHCDLVPFDQWRLLLLRDPPHRLHRQYRCGWELSVDEQQGLCGCALCTGQLDRRRQRRRDRRDAKRSTRRAGAACDEG